MTDYFEVTLQLRNIRKKILDFVKSELASRNMKIAKTTNYRNGVDLYLPSQHFTASLGKKLVEKFGGEMTITTRLFGVSKTGETLYRAAVLYTASDFVPGDIIKIENKIIILKSIGKFACGYDLVKRQNAKILFKGKKTEKLEKHRTQVSKHYPNLEVVHPETYESVAVLNPKQTKKETVDVVVTEKGIYLAE